jgi:hypothetical protein
MRQQHWGWLPECLLLLLPGGAQSGYHLPAAAALLLCAQRCTLLAAKAAPAPSLHWWGSAQPFGHQLYNLGQF